MAEATLDVLDLAVEQNKTFHEYWNSPESWDEWIIGAFSTSPILRQRYDENPDWWDKALLVL